MKTLTDVVSENEVLFAQESLLIEATELISSIMEENGISKSDLARRMGKSKAFITQCLSGEQNLTLRTLADFCTALKFKLQLGAVPTSKQAAKSIHRLYAVGGWAYEKAFHGKAIIDCAASGETDPEDDLCPAA